MFKNTKNIANVLFGKGSLSELNGILKNRQTHISGPNLFLIDHYFKNNVILQALPLSQDDLCFFVDTTDEPTTDSVDEFVIEVKKKMTQKPSAIVGIGGGSTLDTAKAVSNLLNNSGLAADYQGWDLVPNAGVFKIGIPTVSGTGAEASRTCVMTNYKKNLKLGMNSDHTIYDQLILDPELTLSVPREQYFYTGMDTFVHCIESLAGSHRHAIGDSYSKQALALASEVFLSEDMMTEENRGKLMIASYFGGSAIANSFVGIVHPFSAALSMVFGVHHCLANCIVMNAMSEFYPKETDLFKTMLHKQKIELPMGVVKNLTSEQEEKLYLSTMVHEKPLMNALGEGFKSVLTKDRCLKIFEVM